MSYLNVPVGEIESVYPDVFQYNFTQEEYQNYWVDLQNKPGFLRSDGFLVSRVSWFQYAWETFKGWFGFTNYCNSARVNLALKKTLYFGYLFNFNQSVVITDDLLTHISPDYLNYSKSMVSNKVSHALQKELIETYNEHLRGSRQSARFFGESYSLPENIEMIAKLDPQLERWNLERLIRYMSPQDYKDMLSKTQPSSDLSRVIACKMLEYSKYRCNFKDVAECAKKYYPEIVQIYTEEFIQLYGEEKDYAALYEMLNEVSDPRAVDVLIQYVVNASQQDILPVLRKKPHLFDKWLDKLCYLVSNNGTNYSNYKQAVRWVLQYKPQAIESNDYNLWCELLSANPSLESILEKDSHLATIYGSFLYKKHKKNWFFQAPVLENDVCERISKLSSSLTMQCAEIAAYYFRQLLKEKNGQEALRFFQLSLAIQQCKDHAWDLATLLEEESNNLFKPDLFPDVVERQQFYRIGIKQLIEAQKLHDTRERRFNLNIKCRQLIELVFDYEIENHSISLEQLNAVEELFKLIDENPCGSVDDKLAVIKQRYDERKQECVENFSSVFNC